MRKIVVDIQSSMDGLNSGADNAEYKGSIPERRSEKTSQ